MWMMKFIDVLSVALLKLMFRGLCSVCVFNALIFELQTLPVSRRVRVIYPSINSKSNVIRFRIHLNGNTGNHRHSKGTNSHTLVFIHFIENERAALFATIDAEYTPYNGIFMMWVLSYLDPYIGSYFSEWSALINLVSRNSHTHTNKSNKIHCQFGWLTTYRRLSCLFYHVIAMFNSSAKLFWSLLNNYP